MFGLNEISWAGFTKFLGLGLIFWYSLITLYSWVRSQRNAGERNFEELTSEMEGSGSLQPIAVSSMDYPSEILPVNPVENMRLTASPYEETGNDEGWPINFFSERNHVLLAKMLPEIHYQQ